MKRLIWNLTVFLTVAAFTVWGYTSAFLSSVGDLYIPFSYIGLWVLLFFMGARYRSKTLFVTALSYWMIVLVVSVTAAVASSGIAQTFLYKYMTAPAAIAFMPFFGLLPSLSSDVTPFCVMLIVISAIEGAISAYFIARLYKIKSRIILISIAPFAVTVICMILSFASFADAFIGFRNGGARAGCSPTNTVVSIIYILAWICVLALVAYVGAKGVAVGIFVFWCSSFALSVAFAVSYSTAAIIASSVISPLYGFCPNGAFPGPSAVICAGVSALMAFASFVVLRLSSANKIGYIRRN